MAKPDGQVPILEEWTQTSSATEGVSPKTLPPSLAQWLTWSSQQLSDCRTSHTSLPDVPPAQPPISFIDRVLFPDLAKNVRRVKISVGKETLKTTQYQAQWLLSSKGYCPTNKQFQWDNSDQADLGAHVSLSDEDREVLSRPILHPALVYALLHGGFQIAPLVPAFTTYPNCSPLRVSNQPAKSNGGPTFHTTPTSLSLSQHMTSTPSSSTRH